MGPLNGVTVPEAAVAEVRDFILSLIEPISAVEAVPLAAARGRVLAEPLTAPFDVPAHTNAAMDGYALRATDLDPTAPTTLPLFGTIYAGHPHPTPLPPRAVLRIMTGAPIPEGADTVVAQELCHAEGSYVTIPPGQTAGQNIRPAGEDLKAGSLVLPAGRRLTAADLGLASSLGYPFLTAYRPLRVALLSTGDEVIAPGKPRREGQIYDSNRAVLTALLTHLGCTVLDLGAVGDDPTYLLAHLNQVAPHVDAILTSGGVSVGDADTTRTALASLPAFYFWHLAIKPGRPFAFGRMGNAWFFGLPGNPVAVVVSFIALVRDAIRKLQGETPLTPPRTYLVRLAQPLRRKPGRLEYLRVTLDPNDPEGAAYPLPTQGSGVLSSLSRADGFLLIPPDATILAAGDRFPFLPLDGLL
ncbi:MAG: molybdopterin molybdotransferase MoeA [Hydrogenophilus sp.]|nr:molybdopterin molybdotransferase MoeA [Hydrogenophilus sp.]